MSERPLASEVADVVRAQRDESTKQNAVNALCKQRDVTLTEALLEPDRATKNRLMRALTGYRYDASSRREMYTGKPVLPTVRLRSVLKECPDCVNANKDSKGACGRKKGEFHAITYKTGLIEGNADDLHRITNLEGSINEYATCEVDPKTGEFLEAVPVGEAIKILRNFGVGVVHARKKHLGIVQELAHVERYGVPSEGTNANRRPIKSTVVRAPADGK